MLRRANHSEDYLFLSHAVWTGVVVIVVVVVVVVMVVVVVVAAVVVAVVFVVVVLYFVYDVGLLILQARGT